MSSLGTLHLPLCSPFTHLPHGSIASFQEGAYKAVFGHIWVRKTHVFLVFQRSLCVLVSMNVNNLIQCSNNQEPEGIFNLGATSTMAPRNSIRTKTWSFEKTGFPLQFGKNGPVPKACSQSQRRYKPQTKAIWNVDNMNDIVYSLFDFSKLVDCFIYYCLVDRHAISSYCTHAHMYARLTWDPREDLTHSKHVCRYLLWVLQFGYMPYYMGLCVPCVCMSQYWHSGHFFRTFVCS